jgi:hypothetical protein
MGITCGEATIETRNTRNKEGSLFAKSDGIHHRGFGVVGGGPVSVENVPAVFHPLDVSSIGR